MDSEPKKSRLGKRLVLTVGLLAAGSIFLSYSICIGLDMAIPQLPFSVFPNLPVVFWIGMALITGGLVVYALSDESFGDAGNLLIGILVYMLFYGYFPVAERNLRYYDSWTHTAIADFLVKNGRTSPSVFYNNWPGFHLWYAQLETIMGIDFYTFGKISPIIMNLAFFLFLYLFFKKAGSPKIALIGLIMFVFMDDRFYYTVQPTALSIVLYMATLYVGFFEANSRRFWSLTTLMLCASVFIHPANVLWNLIALSLMFLTLRIFRSKLYSTALALTQLTVVLSVWMMWTLAFIRPPLGSSQLFLLERVTNSLGGALTHGAIMDYSPSYWYRGTPIMIRNLNAATLGVVLFACAIGFLKFLPTLGFDSFREAFLKVIKHPLTVRRIKITSRNWALFVGAIVLIADVLMGIFPLVTGLSFSATAIPWGWTDRALMFIWIPACLFACHFLHNMTRKRVKKIASVVFVLMIFPSFLVNHWFEFLFLVHGWEPPAIGFLYENTSSGLTVLTDTSTQPGLWYPLKYNIISEADAARVGQTDVKIWEIFNGTLSPLNAQWTYFFRSRRIEMSFPLKYAAQPNYTMDYALLNSPQANRIYDNSYVTIYYRNSTP